MSQHRTALSTSRSALRAVGQATEHRRRRFVLRWSVITLFAGAFAFTLHGLVTQGYHPDGPFGFVYWLHDAYYLPLRGHLWTALFPYALLWAVPLSLVILLVLLEFLLARGPLRSLQRLLILYFARRPWGRAFLAGDGSAWAHRIPAPQGLASIGGAATKSRLRGFARRVAEERYGVLWARAADPRADKATAHDVDRLLAMADLRLRLSGLERRALMAALESAALASLDERGQRAAQRQIGPSIAQLADAKLALRDAGSPIAEDMEIIVATFATLTAARETTETSAISRQVLVMTAELHQLVSRRAQSPLANPVVLACSALSTLQAAVRLETPEAWYLLESWAASRLGANAALIASAEDLFAFEDWARRAEVACAPPTRKDLLADALGDPAGPAAPGERFAWEGQLP